MFVDDNCIGCGICIDICQIGAISLLDDKAVIDKEFCTECTACMIFCPMEAIHQED